MEFLPNRFTEEGELASGTMWPGRRTQLAQACELCEQLGRLMSRCVRLYGECGLVNLLQFNSFACTFIASIFAKAACGKTARALCAADGGQRASAPPPTRHRGSWETEPKGPRGGKGEPEHRNV